MKKILALCIASIAISSAAFAAPAKAPKNAKLVDVWTCPMTGEAIKTHNTADKGEVVGNSRVHFCCAGCQPQFDKLSEKEKKAKIAGLAKKGKSAKKDAKG